MLKAEIRKEALKHRLSIDDSTYQTLNGSLLNQFIKLDFNAVKAVHIFLPIIEKREPNTFSLIDWLAKNHPEIKIIIPKADFRKSVMTNHEYLGLADLAKNDYNILEPQNPVIYDGEIDMVFIPLLVFDKRGYRVGYGKGFYDRFLENLNAQKIGLSLLPAIDRIEDLNEHDVCLDFCITPTETIKF